jgi:hypothetical protein
MFAKPGESDHIIAVARNVERKVKAEADSVVSIESGIESNEEEIRGEHE